ncbi:MAG: N-acetylmuramoyl-L-alanine amidase [Anaerotignum sp.]|nr:N-acetylmuramoyl-L-alanine amidase [Anaerotignum sp.]
MKSLFHKLSFKLTLMLFACSCGMFLYASFHSYTQIAEQAAVLNTVNDRVIILDAGHGGEDGGAVGKSNLPEKEINLSITEKLKTLLELHGFTVIMTRESDAFIGDNSLPTLTERKKSDMQKRLQIMTEHPNGIFVSIHQNHFDNTALNGAQVFYSANHDHSPLLASSIQTTIVSLLQPENMRVSKAAEPTIYLLRNAQIPAVIVECGFLSNIEEATLLCEESYQNQIAFSIFCGILDYYAAI